MYSTVAFFCMFLSKMAILVLHHAFTSNIGNGGQCLRCLACVQERGTCHLQLCTCHLDTVTVKGSYAAGEVMHNLGLRYVCIFYRGKWVTGNVEHSLHGLSFSILDVLCVPRHDCVHQWTVCIRKGVNRHRERDVIQEPSYVEEMGHL